MSATPLGDPWLAEVTGRDTNGFRVQSGAGVAVQARGGVRGVRVEGGDCGGFGEGAGDGAIKGGSGTSLGCSMFDA